MLCYALFSHSFSDVKKFLEDNFHIVERKGSTEVEKSDRAVIQVSGN